MSDTTIPVYLVQCNHFDPTWRRCWDRRFDYNGQSFVSYAEMEEAIIDDWLTIAESGEGTFVLEQTVSMRKYLERRPERLDTLKRLAAEGRFELLGSGEVIPDANMPFGESLVRNMLYGILWAEQTLGLSVTTGCRADGFGSSAQIPQIFRQCEIKWLPLMSYVTPDNDYWRGLDGTCIYWLPLQQQVLNGSNVKQRPCDACDGEGCNVCSGRGFDQTGRVEMKDWLESLKDGPCGMLLLGGEETLPCMDIVEQVNAKRAEVKHLDYQFGTFKDLASHFQPMIDAVDNPPLDKITRNPDLALSSSGCWVTRIKMNQRNRRSEHGLQTAETLATLKWLIDGQYPKDELTDAWRTLVFTHFHDAITSTHIDAAYDELMEMYDAVDTTICNVSSDASQALSEVTKTGIGRKAAVFNALNFSRSALTHVTFDNWDGDWAEASAPVYDVRNTSDGKTTVSLLAKDVAGLSRSTIAVTPVAEKPETIVSGGRRIENARFVIEANDHGITRIYDKTRDRELIDYACNYAGELILEHDYGDPWATRRDDHERERLSPMTKLVGAYTCGGRKELVFEGKHPGNFHDFEVNWMTWRMHVVLHDGLDYVQFCYDVDWDTHNRRLRVAFPTTIKNDAGDYEIPYGTLRRKRYDQRVHAPSGINGDWPVTHWAAPASDDMSVAIINRGECSYRIENGNVLVSLLRSPGTPWCLYEPEFYRMPLYDGMRDAGVHEFSLALYPFDGPWQESDVTQQAWSYNAPMVAVADRETSASCPIALQANSTMISSLKLAEVGDALIVRLYEYAGKGEDVTLTVPNGFSKAWRVNLLERQGEPLTLDGNAVTVTMKSFQIATVRLER